MRTESLHWTQHQEQEEREGEREHLNVFTIYPSGDVSYNNEFKCNHKWKKNGKRECTDNTAQRGEEYSKIKIFVFLQI